MIVNEKEMKERCLKAARFFFCTMDIITQNEEKETQEMADMIYLFITEGKLPEKVWPACVYEFVETGNVSPENISNFLKSDYKGLGK